MRKLYIDKLDFTRGQYKNRPSKDVIPIKIIKK